MAFMEALASDVRNAHLTDLITNSSIQSVAASVTLSRPQAGSFWR